MDQTHLRMQYDLQLRKTCTLIGVEPQQTIGIMLHDNDFTCGVY